jgi:hypothetical protein
MRRMPDISWDTAIYKLQSGELGSNARWVGSVIGAALRIGHRSNLREHSFSHG